MATIRIAAAHFDVQEAALAHAMLAAEEARSSSG